MSKGSISIDLDRCKGCELCASFCPQHVIVMDEDTLNARGYHPAALSDPAGECTGCAVCSVVCPEACITVYRVPVLARGVHI